jgi:hypothetical protein
MKYQVGNKIPVWWSTGEKDASGNNLAMILEVRDYKGPLDFCDKILKLTAPGTKRGWIEMTITR